MNRPTYSPFRRALSIATVLALFLSTVGWAGQIRSGMQITVNTDDTVNVTSMGSATFPSDFLGFNVPNSPYPYVGGWQHVSGTLQYNDNNGTPTLRFDGAGASVLNPGGVPNSNGTIAINSLVLTGTTTLGANLRATYGGGGPGSSSPFSGVIVATDTDNNIDWTVSGTVAFAAPPVPAVDIQVAVGESAASVTAGSGANNLIHTVTVTNISANPASGLAIGFGQTLPPGVTTSAPTPSVGSVAGTTWTIGNLAPAASATLTFAITASATAPDGSNVVTNAMVSALTEPDSDTNNDSGSESTTVVTSADLSTSQLGPANAVAGTQVTYAIAASNAGPSDAQSVIIADPTPAGYSFASADGPCGLGFPCNVPTLASGGNLVVNVTFNTASNLGGSMVTNTASISSSTSDPDPGNNSSGFTTSFGAEADLALTKTGPATAAAGTQIGYVLTVTNDGPSDATSVSIADTLPAGLTLVSTAGCAEDPTGIPTCSVGTVAANSSAMVNVTVGIDSATTGSLVNSATVSSATTDPVGGNETDSATTDVTAEADLVIIKSGPTMAVAGTQVTYTIDVTNNGPSDAVAVSVADPTPPGYTFVSATAPCAMGFPCAVGDLAANDSASIDVTYDIDPTTTGGVTNTATVSSTTTDPTPANDSSSITTEVAAEADLAITKTGPASATAGGQVTYTIEVTNNGPSQATAVSVADPDPAGTTFASATAPCVGGFPCALGDMAPNDVITFDATFDVAASATGTVVNTATVSASTTDPNGGNDSASVTSSIALDADLALTKTTSTPVAGLGDQVVYELVVDNAGPSDATNVVITDNLPAGQALVSTTGCAEDPTGVPTCTVGTVPAGGSATVTIVATVTAASGFQLNTASVTSDVGDAVAANNASSAGVDIAVIIPTLNQWALALMALLLAILGTAAVRRVIPTD